MVKILRWMMPAVVVGAMATGTAWADTLPVLEFDPGAPQASSGPVDITLGWSFTTNTAVTVVALDAFDPTGDGFVEIYDGLGNVLATANLTASDPQEGSPTLFYTQAIAPVTLLANTTYYISEDIPANPGTNLYLAAAPLTLDPAITFAGEVDALGLASKPTTDTFFGGLGNPGFFGPNFDLAPEPSVFVLLLTVILALAVKERKRIAR